VKKKAVSMFPPQPLKNSRPRGTIHPPTAFADELDVLTISRRQWVDLVGRTQPIEGVATVKTDNLSLIL